MATSTPPNAAPDATPPGRSPVGPAQLIADPYGAYGRLREAGPVHRVTGTDGHPAWVVTRYEDVRRALADECPVDAQRFVTVVNRFIALERGLRSC